MAVYRRPRSVLITIIIFLNVLVYMMWNYGAEFAAEIGLSPRFMNDNFLVSWSDLAQWRLWTLLTSAFSHNMFLHILLNMFVLNSFGPIVERTLGAKRFLGFYLVAGMIGSLGHAVVSRFILDNPEMPALGASGAISGLILLFSLMYPKEKILLFGIIPMPAMIGAVLFVGLDIWGVVAQAEGGGLPIGHGAHLGGAFTGLVYFLILRAQVQRRLREQGPPVGPLV